MRNTWLAFWVGIIQLELGVVVVSWSELKVWQRIAFLSHVMLLHFPSTFPPLYPPNYELIYQSDN
jgi:hypothetical protein